MDLELPSHSVIQFENSPPAMGLSWLDPLYGHIRRREALEIRYQPFAPPGEVAITLHPYLLKEWRNRWYVVGRNENENQVWNLALDRIADVRPTPASRFAPTTCSTPSTGTATSWALRGPGRRAGPHQVPGQRGGGRVYPHQARPRLQQTVRQDASGRVTFSLAVIPNPELMGELRRFGRETRCFRRNVSGGFGRTGEVGGFLIYSHKKPIAFPNSEYLSLLTSLMEPVPRSLLHLRTPSPLATSSGIPGYWLV
ncbi:MAG: WYL domain-containing protein [Haliscomenobacter sp.]|nr:WYL domain-containing protein [Haliscomenobacter sp.]